ncbi:caspase-1 [Orussus abietinus]|uniref:caspase-1 n=1 Tax=Orussus abietinus TaxID=222816 RepID=UPI000626238D|nr:caspase-1 [Orussus abietinus]
MASRTFSKERQEVNKEETNSTSGSRVSDVAGVSETNVDGWPFRKSKYETDFKSTKASTGSVRIDVDSEVYDMSHDRRGVALIFNHAHFKSMPSRPGTVKDCKDLERTLTDHDFEVRIYTDPTIDTITTALKSTAAEDHTDADCLVVVAMSHGESGLLHSYNTLYPVEVLWKFFTADRCPSLAGKPKLVFIQACRGDRLDDGVTIIHETDGAAIFSIPTYADIMIAYSTYDGFFSWRNPTAGSWFIQSICNELNRNGRTRDLLTMMTFVNRRVGLEYESFVPHKQSMHAKKQIPSVVSMLTRLVYFHEKIMFRESHGKVEDVTEHK